MGNRYEEYLCSEEYLSLEDIWGKRYEVVTVDSISDLKGHFKSPKCKVLNQPEIKDTIHKLHANYVLVPSDKAANIVIVCKKYLLY